MLKPCVSNQWGPIRRLENLTSNPEFPTGILRWVPSAWQTELVENYPTSLEIFDFEQRRMSTLRKSSAYDGGRRAIGTFRVGHRAVLSFHPHFSSAACGDLSPSSSLHSEVYVHACVQLHQLQQSLLTPIFRQIWSCTNYLCTLCLIRLGHASLEVSSSHSFFYRLYLYAHNI